jgi:nuclear cap-binding protein subunit 1
MEDWMSNVSAVLRNGSLSIYPITSTAGNGLNGILFLMACREAGLKLQKSSIRHAFLCHLVDCCVRLSYPDHIKSILPPTYTSNTDLWDVKGPRINYFLPNVEASLLTLSQELTSALRIKDSGESIEKCMGMIREWTLTASNDAKAVFMFRDAEGIASQVFVQCLMFIGQKSFSHLLNAVERNITSVQGYLSGERGVALVAHVWESHGQFLEICVDKLTNYRVFTVGGLFVMR